MSRSLWKRRPWPTPPWRHRHHHPEPAPAPVPNPQPEPNPNPNPNPTPTPVPPPQGASINWPSFQGTATLVGTSPQQQVSVYYDATLGAPGLANAQALLADADRVAGINNTIFGVSGVNQVNVIVFALGGVTDGTGGADHASCSYQTGGNIEVCASFNAPARVSSLFEAELSECAMNGNLCGLSTGEALSRWCAAVVDDNALADFVTATAWVQQGMPDYVDQIDPTDQDAVSIGCGMVFLSWLLSTGHTLPAIAQAMVKGGDSGTLAATYAALSGDVASNAWTKFQAAVAAIPGGITSDDPFGALAAATASA